MVGFQVGPNPGSLVIQSFLQMQATATYNTGNTVTSTYGAWSSANNSIASVNSSGLVSGVSAGYIPVEVNQGQAEIGVGYECFGYNLSCPYQDFAASATVNVGNPGSLSCAPVPRGGTTTCSVSGASNGAKYSGWTFTSSIGTVTDPQATSSWSGTAVTSGTVSVTVNVGAAKTLSAPLVVSARNWHTSPGAALKVPNGTLPGGKPPLPPEPTNSMDGELGLSAHNEFADVTTNSVAGGPNNGFVYLPGNSPVTVYFDYEINPVLENVTSGFYQMQTGTWSPSNPTGPIAAATLDAQTVRHESSSVIQSHYLYWESALNQNSPGDFLESQIGPPGSSPAALLANLSSGYQNTVNSIKSLAAVEPYGVNLNDIGQFDGNVCFSPYTGCPK